MLKGQGREKEKEGRKEGGREGRKEKPLSICSS